MDMTGSYRIDAPRETVWAALNDPEVLRRCIPGCETVEKLSDTEFTARVVAKVGPVKATFNGKVTLSDLDPPNSYRITGEGTGGAAGFGKGGAAVRLTPDGADATTLDYTAHAEVGGKLAQVGSRLIGATARKMADDFFAKFAQEVGRAPVENAPAEGTSIAGDAGLAPPGVVATGAPPEVPIPVPVVKAGSGFYVPWLALILAVAVIAVVALSA